MLGFQSSEAMKHTSLVPNLLSSVSKAIPLPPRVKLYAQQRRAMVCCYWDRTDSFQLSGRHTCARTSAPATRSTDALALSPWKLTGGGQLETSTNATVSWRHMDERLGSREYLQRFDKGVTDWSSNLNAMLSTRSGMLHQSEEVSDFHLQENLGKFVIGKRVFFCFFC